MFSLALSNAPFIVIRFKRKEGAPIINANWDDGFQVRNLQVHATLYITVDLCCVSCRKRNVIPLYSIKLFILPLDPLK